ncbi:MAG TPA: hypothetical protein VI750_05420, partial [Pyrinomonadaceae bacterium]|nr:hypothetical protein [Pyrinomonadaceae bacterium]
FQFATVEGEKHPFSSTNREGNTSRKGAAQVSPWQLPRGKPSRHIRRQSRSHEQWFPFDIC